MNTRTFSSFAACKAFRNSFLGAPLPDSYRSRSSDALSVHERDCYAPLGADNPSASSLNALDQYFHGESAIFLTRK